MLDIVLWLFRNLVVILDDGVGIVGVVLVVNWVLSMFDIVLWLFKRLWLWLLGGVGVRIVRLVEDWVLGIVFLFNRVGGILEVNWVLGMFDIVLWLFRILWLWMLGGVGVSIGKLGIDWVIDCVLDVNWVFIMFDIELWLFKILVL